MMKMECRRNQVSRSSWIQTSSKKCCKAETPTIEKRQDRAVSARFLMALFDSIFLIALAGWIGSALFLSVGVIPLFFKQLRTEDAEKLVRTLLPRYGVWGAICGALTLSSLVAVPLCYPEFRGARVGVQALAIISCILITLYVGNSATATPDTRRAPGASSGEQEPHWYRRTVALNVVVVLSGIALLIAFTTRGAPMTSGIVELTPEEQARYDEALGQVIEQVEVKYGFRPPSSPKPDESFTISPAIDAETVKEIESFYVQKRRKDDLRRGRGTSPKLPSGARAPSGVASP
jgi:hypothetical protein